MNKSLEDILKRRYGVSDEEYADALRLHGEKGGSVSDVLLRRKVITETQLLDALSEQYEIPFWPELPLESFGEDRTRSAPIGFLKRHAMVPLVLKNIPATGETTLPADMVNIIAVNDPSAFQPLDDLARMIGFSAYNLVLSTKSAIFAAINLIFDMSQGTAEQLVQHMEEDGSTIISEIEDTADLLEDTSDAPIIKLVNHIISQSIKARASDIHIEPYQDSFKVRYRVDGILYDLLTPPKWIQPSLISRIKVMSKLNIAEKRLPQDGRLEVKIGSQNVDVRVSTLPTTFGERVVMRLLNKSEEVLNLKELGLSPEYHERFNQLVTQPNGIILVTGPTGSGKTTTLYSVLASIIKPDINIITIEDPVEYQLKGHQPDTGEPENRPHLCPRPALHCPPGSGRDPDRRNPGQGDRHHRRPVGPDRPPGLLHPAHQRLGRCHYAIGGHRCGAVSDLLRRAGRNRPAAGARPLRSLQGGLYPGSDPGEHRHFPGAVDNPYDLPGQRMREML